MHQSVLYALVPALHWAEGDLDTIVDAWLAELVMN